MKLLQINPVLRTCTSTGRIIREIGDAAMASGWESYIAYSAGRDGKMECTSRTVPVGDRMSVAFHGLATRLFDRHGLASVEATKKFIKEIERINPDVIHIHNIHGYFLNYEILFDWLSRCGKQVIWTVHDCWLFTGHCYHYMNAGCDKWKYGCGQCPQTREFPKSWLIDRSAKNWRDKKNAFCSIPSDKMTIVTVSDWLKGEMQQSFLKDFRYKVIHNGIDTEVFKPSDGTVVRKRYGIGDRKMYMGAASIWSTAKGLDDFMSMASMLTPQEVIVLVGLDKNQMTRMPANIIGIPRTSDVHELAELYSAADAFLNLTYQDNYPTVNLESISCGTPVVTYRTGGSPESVIGQCGMVTDCGDVAQALAAARKIAATDRSVWRDNCRAYGLANFRKADRYADYIKLYKELLNG